MSGARILVVEDEPSLGDVLEAYLRREGHATERAASGTKAWRLLQQWKPDLVLLDLMLPGMDGWEVLRRLPPDDPVRVIVITARAEQVDKLLGLRLGADDYVVKPFDPNEVVLRVRAVLRRVRAAAPSALRFGTLEVDTVAVDARVSGERLSLTPTEYRLLELLARHPKRTFRRAELLEHCWPDGDALERTVDVHVGSLRRKLEAAGTGALIETVRGTGYRLWPT